MEQNGLSVFAVDFEQVFFHWKHLRPLTYLLIFPRRHAKILKFCKLIECLHHLILIRLLAVRYISYLHPIDL